MAFGGSRTGPWQSIHRVPRLAEFPSQLSRAPIRARAEPPAVKIEEPAILHGEKKPFQPTS